ncbi:MAG: maleylpyruvate isomerase family mycothiol-dependent enzyme [Actinomycetota bacterium]|nr:maleylpyruvate isomerase family mycothiol-dependent enzyme [Actinomycetota bacterium]
MGDLGDVYDKARTDVAQIVSELSETELARRVPATPDWTIKDVVAHLTGIAERAVAGDFPVEFFGAYGQDKGVRVLNDWTDRQVSARAGADLHDILMEWEKHAGALVPMIRGDAEWPQGAPAFGDRMLITDIAAHLHDVYGALGLKKGRGDPPVKIGLTSYLGGMDLRMKSKGAPAIEFRVEDRSWTIGGDRPEARVSAPTRFELFRALSGRRSPDQIKALEWNGDPGPFIEYFYPYGIRPEPLEE